MRRLFNLSDTSYFQKLNVLFFSLNFVYFCGMCVYFGFLVIYLTTQGFSSFECGIVNTVCAFCLLLFQPLAGYITDSFLSIKKYLMIAITLSIGATFLLPFMSHLPLPLVLLAVVPMSLLFQPTPSLADTWAVTLREQYPYLDYGKNRGGGSIGYSVMSLAAGTLIGQFGYHVLFILSAVFSVLLLVILLQIPDVPCKNKRVEASHLPATERMSFFAVVKELGKMPTYVIFLVASTLSGLGWRALHVNVTFKVLELGGGDNELGIAFAICAIAEVPVLLFATVACRRFKLNYLLLASLILEVLRGLTYFLADNMMMFYLSQALQAFAFGLFLAVSLEIINKLVPTIYRATAVTCMISATSGLGGITGNFLGGYWVEEYGVNHMAFLMTIALVAAAVIYLVFVLYQQKRHPDRMI